MLLRAFEALRGAGVDARLTVAGATDEEVAPLLLDTEGVEVAGRVSEDEKWRLLGEADLLCAPSSAARASAWCSPRRSRRRRRSASRIAGYRNVVRSRQDGLLVPPGDAVELGEALRDLALDPERRQCMARSARERAERFAWPQVTGEVLEVYEEAIAQPPASRAARFATNAGVNRRARGRASARAGSPRSRSRTRPLGAPAPPAWRAARPWSAGPWAAWA